MDLATPDSQPPEPAPVPRRLPDPAAVAVPPPNPLRPHDLRRQSRLQALVGADDTIIAWTRGWVSRDMRLHRVLVARTLDFLVLTPTALLMYSTGFFTRRPRRCVFSAELELVSVADDEVADGRRRLRVTVRESRTLRLELGATDSDTAFADSLVARTRRADR
ncbi:MAG TPA: hypothetical protein VL119_08200 [Acidimicrobiia bacterium]|nr:hypothetical protein [Acidimicrobiia bacterium]